MHDVSQDSVPIHATLSMSILPLPCPKCARLSAVAPTPYKTKKTIYIFISDYNFYLMNYMSITFFLHKSTNKWHKCKGCTFIINDKYSVSLHLYYRH